MNFDDKKGFSIVEILVALGLVAVIGAALASVITNAAKQQKGIQAKDQQREITAELRTLLSDRTACLNSFGGINPSGAGASVAAIKDAAGAVRYNLTDKSTDKTGLLQFTDFRLSNWTAGTGNADFRVKLSKIGDTGTVREILPDVITIKAKVAGAVITECFSISTVSDNLWKIGTSNPSDIFYGAGNVGIGTSVPTNLIEVKKDQNSNTAIRIENADPGTGAFAQFEVSNTSTGGAFGIQGTGNTGFANWNSNDTYAYGSKDMVVATTGTAAADSIRFTTQSIPTVERMRITNSGKVGIGTTGPTGLLSVSASPTSLGGTAMSSILNSNAGSLGTAVGDELALASIGFTSANQSALGIRAYRAANGTDWTTTALGLGMDVDNTPRAGGAAIWLNANGNVGVGTTTPTQKLQVDGKLLVNQEAFSPGLGKVSLGFDMEFDGGIDSTFVFFNTGAPTGATVFNSQGQNTLTITNTGNVGIGTGASSAKLEVAGGIRPMASSPGISCAPNPKGSQAYDSTSGAPLYCDGVSWNAVGGGGTLSIDVWKCPDTGSCDDGQAVTGAWASFGCNGQVTSVSICRQQWFNGGSQSCTNNCTYLGKLRIN